MTHFERLGLSQCFALDPADLERAYLARSRELHPDFHQQSSTAEQRASMELSAALNEAYATLKQPFRRGEYLLGLLGGPTAAEHKEMAPAFLEEMLDLRMEIEELRADPNPDSLGRKRMTSLLTGRSENLIRDLASRFAQLDGLDLDVAKRKQTLTGIRQILDAAKYIQGLIRDLKAD